MTEPAKIEALTPEQEARFPEFRDKWIAFGLSTDPANREVGEEGVKEAYQAAGLAPPTEFIWCDSPYAGAMEAAKLITGNPKLSGEALLREARSALNKAITGQQDAGWLSFYDFIHEVMGVEEAGRLSGLIKVAQNLGWWWPFEGIAVLTERPKAIYRDPQDRLHFEKGKALEYPDGWGVYAWHGTRVPEWVVMDPTVKKIHAEENVEIRRCAIENLGWDKYVEDAGLQLGAPVADPGNPGQTLRLSQSLDIFGRGNPVKVLLCTNGTTERGGVRRKFGLTVPGTLTDPVEAAAWTYGWDKETYQNLQRRT